MQSDAETKYERAKANTFGIGMACFRSEFDQHRAFSSAFEKEAIAARGYISELEAALARARAAMEAMAQSWSDRSEKLAPTGKRANHVDRHVAAVLRGKADELRALARDTDTGGESAD